MIFGCFDHTAFFLSYVNKEHNKTKKAAVVVKNYES